MGAVISLSAVVPASATAPTGGEQTSKSEQAQITDGVLNWGVKASWRSYAGPAELSGGARQPEPTTTSGAGGPFEFPLDTGSFDPVGGTTKLQFSGAVRWTSHYYPDEAPLGLISPPPGYTGSTDIFLLDVTMSNPSVEISAERSVITAELLSRNLDTWEMQDYGRIVVANLAVNTVEPSRADGRTTWNAIDAIWGVDAVAPIGYEPGLLVDPVSFTYAGEGGRPVLNEVWTAPGSYAIEIDRSAVVDPEGQSQIQSIDVSNSIAVVRDTQSIRAFDLESGTQVGQALPVSASERNGLSAVRVTDSARGVHYFSSDPEAWPYAPIDRALVWDAGVGRFEIVQVAPFAAELERLLWDETNDVAYGFHYDAASNAWTLLRYTRETVDAFTEERIPLPQAPAGYGAEWYSINAGAVVLSDGSLLMNRVRQFPSGDESVAELLSQHITISGDQATVIEVPGTDLELGLNRGRSYTALKWSDSSNSGYFVRLTRGPRSVIVQEFKLDDAGRIDLIGQALDLGSVAGNSVAIDSNGALWGYSPAQQTVWLVSDGALRGSLRSEFFHATLNAQIEIGKNGHLFVNASDGNPRDPSRPYPLGIAAVLLSGVSPTIIDSPKDVTVVAASNRTATFTASASGTPNPSIQWQRRSPGELKFSDIPNEAGSSLQVPTSATDNGVQLRAVFANAAGTIATEPATLTVLSAPVISQQPIHDTVQPGTEALFQILASGNPEPVIEWQVQVGNNWTPVSGDGFTTEGGNLTVLAAQESARFRAKVSNSQGTVYSDIASLKVELPEAGDDGSITGLPNSTGARTMVTPGLEVKNSTTVTVTGEGFKKGTNTGGAYVLFGYVTKYPSANGTAGAGYDYIPGQENQRFIAWPGAENAGASNGLFTDDGSFEVDGLAVASSFTGQSGAKVDCLDNSVQCGVLTIGAHGRREANLETFTPVYFEGQSPDVAGSAPKVISEPQSVSVTEGGTASFTAGAVGWPIPVVQWQSKLPDAGDWVRIPDATALTYTSGQLELSASGTQYRAVFTNSEGETATNAATLTVTKPAGPDDHGTLGVPDVQNDGSIVGDENAAGAYTHVSRGIDLPVKGATLKVDGQGFTKNTNHSGVYVLFGYLAKAPSAGANAGNGYDFNPGGGASGQEGQLFVAWPDNTETGSAANATFTSIKDGGFSTEGLYAVAEFTGQSGMKVDCLDGSVVCGVITIGAHGSRDADLETFTPVFFEGQEVPTTSIVVPGPPVKTDDKTTPQPPVINPPSDGNVVEGSLVWGVKQSFRNYITGPIAKGSIQVSSGASTQNGLFWFGQRSTDWSQGAGTGSTSYGGAVRFTGHSGILDLTFSNPVVRIDSQASGTLLVSVNGAQVAIGSLNLAAAGRRGVDGGVSYSNVPVTLTAAGARVFSYGSSQFYSPGASMDALSFVVGKASTSTPGGAGAVAAYVSDSWTAPAEPPANTGLWIDPEQLKALSPGTEITAIGEGFEPNEQDIKVVLYSDPVVLEQNLVADADGTATWTGIIPLDIEPGQHTLTLQGSVNHGIAITVLDRTPSEGCTVTDATLSWGFKETFRSYISGSIAHGEWETSGGATYQTLEFEWHNGTGAFDAEPFTGQASFQGTIRFAGHDGLLDTTVKDPTIMFSGPGKAYLLLDVIGVTMDDALAGNTEGALTFEQVPFVELDLASGTVDVSEDGARITAIGVPTAITSQGYQAFPNYEQGTEFDPISFEITTESGCELALLAENEALAGDPTVEAISDDPDLTWLWWTGGGLLAAAVIAGLAVWLIRRRYADEAGAAGSAEPSLVDDLLGGGR